VASPFNSPSRNTRDVEIGAERRQPRIARRGLADQRAGLGIALAVAAEIRRESARQYADVALHVTRRESRGDTGKGARARREAYRARIGPVESHG
jgi:hypothetical protein